MASESPLASFLTLFESSKHATGKAYSVIFLNKFLRDYIKMLISTYVDSATLPIHNCQLTKANANNEAIRNAFRNG